jgi:periplasmic protein TonB
VFSQLPKRRTWVGPTTLSLAAHAAAGLALFIGLRTHPVRVFSLPGSNLGTRVELAYLPGRAAPAPTPTRTQAKSRPKTVSPRSFAAAPSTAVLRSPQMPDLPTPATPNPKPAPPVPSPPAAVPDATSGSDSWGAGAVQIAFTTYSPSPAPDLSMLPHGVQGDVVIDVTIDSGGKVSDVTLLHTLGYGIETNVLNTLKTWTFRPATKDGTPIASVQELHFHYGPV